MRHDLVRVKLMVTYQCQSQDKPSIENYNNDQNNDSARDQNAHINTSIKKTL